MVIQALPRGAYCRRRFKGFAGGDAAVMAGQAISGLAELLRQLRAEAQLTQQELAKSAGVSPRSGSDLERGIHSPAPPATALAVGGRPGPGGPGPVAVRRGGPRPYPGRAGAGG